MNVLVTVLLLTSLFLFGANLNFAFADTSEFNLVRNPSFEESYWSSKYQRFFLKDWTWAKEIGTNGYIEGYGEWDKTVAHSGDASIKIVVVEKPFNARITWKTNIEKLEFKEGAFYKLRFWYKSTSSKFQVGVTYFSSDWRDLQGIQLLTLPSSVEWTQTEWIGLKQAPTGDLWAEFSFVFLQFGSGWVGESNVDDFEMYEVTEEPPPEEETPLEDEVDEQPLPEDGEPPEDDTPEWFKPEPPETIMNMTSSLILVLSIGVIVAFLFRKRRLKFR